MSRGTRLALAATGLCLMYAAARLATRDRADDGPVELAEAFPAAVLVIERVRRRLAEGGGPR